MLLLTLALLIFGCNPLPKGDLEPGLPVEKEIGGGEVHSYRLPVAESSYISLRIEQPGIDIKARLDGPRGVSVPVFDDRGKGAEDGPDRLAWISNAPGEYRLVVQPRDPKAPRGRYQLELWELRPARTEDADRLAAEQEYSEGLRLLWKKEREDVLSPCLAHFEKALQLWRGSGDTLGQVDALIRIAEIENVQGKAKEAAALGEEAVGLARTAKYRAGEARALLALANAHMRLAEGHPIESLQRSLHLWKELHHAGRQGTVLYAMGTVYYNQSQLDQALDAWLQARALLDATGDPAVRGSTLVGIANIQMDRGETAQALENCTQALRLSRSTHEARAEAVALYCLGATHQRRGELETARQLVEDSLAINLRLGNPDSLGWVYQALGAIYINLGDLDRALLEYDQGLTICRAIHRQDLEAQLLTQTGLIYKMRGDLKRAMGYYDQALKISEKIDWKSGIANALYNTGMAYTSMGKPREALAVLLHALELRSQINQRAAQASILLEIGTAYRNLGDLRQAESYFSRALDLARNVESTNLQAEGLFRWAALDAAEGRYAEALDKIDRSLGTIEAVRSGVSGDKLRTLYFASKREYYELYIDLLIQLEKLHPGRYLPAALEASERARARGLLDLIAEGHINLQEGIAPELRQREIELGARLSSLQDRLGKLPPGGSAAATLENELDRAQADMEGLESQIRRRYQRYADVRYPIPLKSGEIQGLLDKRTALLQYFTGKKGSFLFVVTHGSIEGYPLPPRAALAEQVTTFRQLLQGRVGRRKFLTFQRSASRLYSELLGAAEGALAGKSRLVISPDGPLYLLPFEALLVPGKGGGGRTFVELPYLLRRFTVSYVPSASILKGLRAASSSAAGARPAAKELMGFARSEGPTPLPEAEEEVRRIASLYPTNAVRLYVGPSATEENVKKNPWLDRARYIHFATHGDLNEIRPHLSGLELTPAPGSPEDGTLRVYEIFNLRLNADLLTLSACDTARGMEISGEGVVGLTRAFFYAGAKSLLVSLWPVSDRSTPTLMFDFYRSLGASHGKADALRDAKLAMAASENYADPYFWAPFILSGDPGQR